MTWIEWTLVIAAVIIGVGACLMVIMDWTEDRVLKLRERDILAEPTKRPPGWRGKK